MGLANFVMLCCNVLFRSGTADEFSEADGLMTDLVEFLLEGGGTVRLAKARSLAARQKEEADIALGKELPAKSLQTLKEKQWSSSPNGNECKVKYAKRNSVFDTL